jgi:hypothetical protein
MRGGAAIVAAVFVALVAGSACYASEAQDGVTYYGNEDLKTTKRSAPTYGDSNRVRPSDEIMLEVLGLCDARDFNQDVGNLSMSRIDGYISGLDRARDEAQRGASQGRDYQQLVSSIDSCKRIWVGNKKIKTERAQGSQATKGR